MAQARERGPAALAVARENDVAGKRAGREHLRQGSRGVEHRVGRVVAAAVALHALVAEARVVGRDHHESRAGKGQGEIVRARGLHGRSAAVGQSHRAVIAHHHGVGAGPRRLGQEHACRAHAGRGSHALCPVGNEKGLHGRGRRDVRDARGPDASRDLVHGQGPLRGAAHDVAADRLRVGGQVRGRHVHVLRAVRAFDVQARLGRLDLAVVGRVRVFRNIHGQVSGLLVLARVSGHVLLGRRVGGRVRGIGILPGLSPSSAARHDETHHSEAKKRYDSLCTHDP
jgi:hypothetical protein